MRLLATLAATAALLSPIAAQGQPCTAESAVIYAGQNIEIGSVQITNSASYIRIDVEINAPRTMSELHIYVGPGPLPVNGGGNVAPGQFPYQWNFQPNGKQEHRAMIPIAQTGLQCDDQAVIAVHVVSGNETGWAFGNPFGGNQWGWSMDYEICCEGCGSSTDLNLTSQPLQTGTNVDLTVDNANPNETIWYAYSCKPVICDAGPTFAALGGLALDLGAPVHIIGSAVADANGVAVIVGSVPPPTSVTVGKFTNLQAVAKRGTNGADSVKSNVLSSQIL